MQIIMLLAIIITIIRVIGTERQGSWGICSERGWTKEIRAFRNDTRECEGFKIM